MHPLPVFPRANLRQRLVATGLGLLLLVAVAVGVAGWGWLGADGERRAAARQSALLDERARQVEEQVRLRRDAVMQMALRLGADVLPPAAALGEKADADSLVKALFDVVIVTDATGQLVFDSPVVPGRRGTRAPDRARFEQELSRPSGSVIGPVAGRATDERMVTFIAPIRSSAEKPIGLMVASLSLSGTRAMRAFGPPAVDGGGFTLSTREASPRLLTGAAAPPGGDAMIRQRDIENAPWTLTYRECREDAMAPTESLRRQMLAFVAAAWLVSSLLWWAACGWLLRPLQAFHRAIGNLRLEDPWTFAAPASDPALHSTAGAFAGLLGGLRGDIATARREVDRLHGILMHAPDALCSIDGDGIIREWNRQAEATFGWRREEMLGRPALATLAPASNHDDARQRFAEHFDGREAMVLSREVEVPVLRRDGTPLTVEMSAATLGKPPTRQTTVFLRDVSTRAAAQAALQASERRLRMITDSLPAFIGYVDAGQHYRFINRNSANIGGLQTQALIGRSLFDSMGPQAYAVARPHVEAALRGETRRFEMDSIAHAGRVYQVDYVPDVRDDGLVQGLYAMILDISGERQAAARLADSERRLREITDSVPGMVLCLTPRQDISFCNQTAGDWLGAIPGGLLGRPLGEALGPAASAAWAPHVRATLQGRVVEFDFVLGTPAGALELHTVLTPHRDADGGVAGVYALSTDVTALKEVERQLQNLARFDPLTGLPNRRQFDERLSDVLGRSRRTGLPVALMFIDLDHFKSINDTLGHAAGDAVLKEVALRLQACLRETDAVSRVGGDEFVAVLEGPASAQQAHGVAAKAVAALREPIHLQGRQVRVTASIGVAFHDGQAPVSAADLAARADALLYDVKESGRDGFRMAVS